MTGESEEMRILFAGGGTAGHLMPAVNIAIEMRKLNNNIVPRFVGKTNGMESAIVRRNGFEIDEINVIGMKRTLFGIINFAIRWFGGYRQALRLLDGISPVAVIGTGGYISAPVVKAAAKRGIPVFLQEQNSLPGLATRTLSKYALIIFAAYESAIKYLDKKKCRIEGNPIRTDITSSDRDSSIGKFGLDPDKRTILVIGGSSGAEKINSAILELTKENKISGGWQILWQTGKKDYDRIKSSIPDNDERIKISEFIDDMSAAYAVADLVISRAGAMALSEITAVGLPSLLIPYPYATGNHQMLNARDLEKSEAAIVIPEAELNQKFVSTVEELMNDDNKRKSMSESAKRLGKPDAARNIARHILEEIDEI